MAKEENRIFVGGLSWETTERTLERAFSQFGKVIESQVIVERDTGRSRGFGFITFAERRSVETAIREMHNGDLDGRNISVNKAEPRMNSNDSYGYGSGGYSSGGRGYRSEVDEPRPFGRDDCFNCGRPGHWARECPSAAGGRTGRLSPPSRYGGSRGRGDSFGGTDRYDDRYIDDRYNGGRYLERNRLGSRDGRYGGGHDRYASDRYTPSADRFSGDRYGVEPGRYLPDFYDKERSYERDGGRANGSYYRDGPRGYDRDGPRIGGSERYGSGGPVRYDGGYKDRSGPYDRPSRGGRLYDDQY